jgi:hypothetical protein
MTEADSLFGQEHVRRYRETNGEVGYLWQGATVLLTTKGRTPVSRAPHPWPTTGLGTTSSSSRRTEARPRIQAGTETSPKSRRSRCM